MKKVILGSCMFMAGLISCAILLGCAMQQGWIIDGNFSVYFNLSRFGLTSALFLFAAFTLVGLALAVRGIGENDGSKEAEETAEAAAEAYPPDTDYQKD